MSDIEEIRKAIGSYAQLMDSGRFDEWAGLFVEDAEFISIPPPANDRQSQPWVARGRAEIVEKTRNALRPLHTSSHIIHLGGEPVVTVEGQKARASWDFVVFCTDRTGSRITSCGRYYASFIKLDGRWFFSRRLAVQGGATTPAAPFG